MSTTTVELLPSPSHVIGPTWRRRKDGKFHLPERTLAWQCLVWANRYVLTPGGPEAGEPFKPTREQARFLAWWFAVDEDGKFCYRQGVLRRLKGWGKDPVAALLSLIELCGPAEFSHFDTDGNPVGKEKHASWIQIAAVSQDQTKNTFTLYPSMISKQMIKDYHIEINKTLIYASKGRMIEAVTNSPATIEGGRPTFVIKNETQWWIESNGGKAMAGVIEGNVTKGAYGRCRILSICNGHVPGMESDAEADWDKYLDTASGQFPDMRFLYDALEAPADTPVSEIPSPLEDPEGYEQGLQKLREGITIARGDAVWLDVDTILASFFDGKTPATESRRKFLNQINATEDSFIAPFEWDACQAEISLGPGETITLGFDGSKSNDHTGLVACRVSDGAIFVLRHWNPSQCPNEEVPREAVDQAVQFAFENYKVVAFRADVREFESFVDKWAATYKNKLLIRASPKSAVAFDMRNNTKQFAFDAERFRGAVLEGSLVHDGNKALKTHVCNAHVYPTQWEGLFSIKKPSRTSTRKIDLAVCAILAYGARQELLNGKTNFKKGAAAYR